MGHIFWLPACLITMSLLSLTASRAEPIDRHALVTRHNISLTQADPLTPLSVGNGEFAFTADITGLQTFPEFHAGGIELHTLSQWAWHSASNPDNYHLEEILTPYAAQGRTVLYPDGMGGFTRADIPERVKQATAWLRANPHRLDLGRIGLVFHRLDGNAVRLQDLVDTRQTLDLWRGELESRFTLVGLPAQVQTICHPRQDLIAVRIVSPLLADGRLGLSIAFPYAAEDWQGVADWNAPERHQTRIEIQGRRCDFARTLDATHYYVRAAWSPGGTLMGTAPHRYEISTPGIDHLELVIAFAPHPITTPLPTFAQTRTTAARHWRAFWTTGGAIDLSGSRDPRAGELERRIVLSQYLTAIQCAGSRPPQETGLTQNSWYGKFHLEMHWWHAAHFALWGRIQLLERSMPWYLQILPSAQETARRQGYRGARWPKMIGPDGRESPSDVGVFLIWQQPHPIYYAELIYRARPTRKTLERYRTLVYATADFMASYPTWDEATQRYVLGPPLIPAQESYGPQRRQTLNPTFELAYWRWGLETAQRWRQRLGLERDPAWEQVLQRLAKPTVHDGVYTAIETPPYIVPTDHPSLVGALGFVPPTPLIDAEIMRRTLEQVLRTWNLASTWGWDYPLLAMTAARLGEPEQAVDALMLDSPKNRYLANGHNYQRPNLPLYLPGNGGLLMAVALMAAGWDGAPHRHAPGFPDNGQWVIRSEGLQPAP